MDLNRLPWRNLSRRPLRTAALLVLTFFLSFVIFAGSMTVVSLQNGLETLENRLGADIIVVPNTAKRKVDPKTMILDGTPGYFYMEREKMTLISHIEGVEKVSPQIFLASLSASCCSVPVQIIGFEPETDFIIQPWIRESYGRELAHGDVVVGSAVNADVGDTIRFYNKDCRIVAKLAATGTGLDTAVYTKAETIRTLIEASSKMGLNPLFEGDVENVISSVYIKVKDGIIEDVKFNTFGCGSAIASSSMATEMIKGKSIDDALELSNKAVVEALDGLPTHKIHCSVLAEEAVKAAVKDYYDKNGIEYDKEKFAPDDCPTCGE